MKTFGTVFDPSEAATRSISAIASDHLESMNPAAIGKREIAKFHEDSVRAASTARGAINALDSLIGFNPASSKAALRMIAEANSAALESCELSGGLAQTLAESSHFANHFRAAQDELKRTFSRAMGAFDNADLVAGFNLASSAHSARKEWDKLLDVTNLYNKEFLLDEVRNTIENLAVRQRDEGFTSLTNIAQSAFSSLPPSLVSRSAIENLAPWTIAEVLGEHVRQLGSADYAQELIKAIGNVDLLAIREAALVAAERISEDFEVNAVSLQDIQDAIARVSKEAIEEVVEPEIGKATKGLVKHPHWTLHLLRGLMLAIFLETIASLIVHVLTQAWVDMHHDSPPKESTRTVAIAATPSSSVAQEITLLVVKPEVLNLRAGPSTTQRVVTSVSRGRVLRLLSRKREWGRVAYVDPQGQGVMCTGWVKLSFTSPLDRETTKLLQTALTTMTLDEQDSD